MGNESILRETRKKYGITQEKLGGPTIKRYVINKIENGKQELNRKQALILASRFNEILREIGIDDEITAEQLLGIKNTETSNMLQRLKLDKNNGSLEDINNAINKLNNDEATKLILDSIDILKLEFSINAVEIRDFCDKLIALNIDDYTKLIAYNYLIAACHSLSDFKEAIIFSKFIEDKVEASDNDNIKSTFYNNVADCFFKNGDYKKCIKYMDKANKYNDKYKKLNSLIVKADIKAIENDFDKAEKDYYGIIEKSKKLNSHKNVANCFSNIADIHRKKHNMEMAQKCINTAIEEVKNNEVSLVCQLNVYFNYLLIGIELDELSIVNEYSKMAIELAIKINNKEKQNRIIWELAQFYKKHKSENEVLELIENYKVILNSDTAVKIGLLFGSKQNIQKILKMCYNI